MPSIASRGQRLTDYHVLHHASSCEINKDYFITDLYSANRAESREVWKISEEKLRSFYISRMEKYARFDTCVNMRQCFDGILVHGNSNLANSSY